MKKFILLQSIFIFCISILPAQTRPVYLIKGDWGNQNWTVPATTTVVPNSSVQINLKESCMVEVNWNADVKTGAPDINQYESNVNFTLYINGTAIDRAQANIGAGTPVTNSAVIHLLQQFPAGNYTIDIRGKGKTKFTSSVAYRYFTVKAIRASAVEGL